MNSRNIFTPDDARTLRKKGHLVVPLPDSTFLTKRAEIIRKGLEHIESLTEEDVLHLDTARNNKDAHGRLLQGIFRRPADGMVQCNIVDFTDGRMGEYFQVLQKIGLDVSEFFRAIRDLNDNARFGINELGRAIDRSMEQAVAWGELTAAPYKISDALSHGRTKFITSATSYIAEYGSDYTSARPNTAAFAIYWIATNPGMRIFDADGEAHDLSGVETDPGKIFIIPGTELTYASRGFIKASMHPIFPKEKGAKRFTLRTFVYFSQELMNYLIREHTSMSDILLR